MDCFSLTCELHCAFRLLQNHHNLHPLPSSSQEVHEAPCDLPLQAQKASSALEFAAAAVAAAVADVVMSTTPVVVENADADAVVAGVAGVACDRLPGSWTDDGRHRTDGNHSSDAERHLDAVSR